MHNARHRQREDGMLHMLRRFFSDDSGATSIEYGLICAGIAVALITIIQSMGGDLVALLTKLFDVL